MSYRIGLIHSDTPTAVILSINGFNHFLRGRRLYFYPAVHLFHIHPTKNILIQIAQIENELKETGLVKTVLCSEVHKKSLVAPISKTPPLRITMNCSLFFLFSFFPHIKVRC